MSVLAMVRRCPEMPFSCSRNDDGVFVAVIDALGHGPDAHKLAMQLSDALSKWLPEVNVSSPEGALEVLHEGARGTRGAVAAVAWLNSRTLEGSVVGIGNVRCRLFGSGARTFEFREGVLGSARAIATTVLVRSAAVRCAALVFRWRDRPLRA